MADCILSSEELNKLNTVKFYKHAGDTTSALFGDKSNPLYLTGGNLPDITMSVGVTSLWDNHPGFNKTIATGLDFLRGTNAGKRILGDLSKLSTTVDLPQKFVYSGSSDQNFSIECMLVNREGWNVSIAPYLTTLSDWLLPARLRNISINPNSNPAIASGIAEAKEEAGTAGKAVLGFLETAFEAVGQWMGDAWLLSVPDQFDNLSTSKDMEIVVGRYRLSGIYIDSVNISIPRAFMKNESGDTEPDHVKLTFSIKTLRQTTRSTFNF